MRAKPEAGRTGVLPRMQIRRAALLTAGAAGLVIASPSLIAATAAPSSALLSSPPCASPDDWTMYQHGPDHHAVPGCSLINPLNVATLHPSWLFQTPAPVTASPTVANGQVYVGDANGNFYDIDAKTGTLKWPIAFSLPKYHCDDVNGQGPATVTDRHSPSYGEITSSATVATIKNGADPTVFFGGGGTLFALDANSGECLWSQDLDPDNPTSAMEVESSPVVFQHGNGASDVIVGSDANEAPATSAPPGIQAFDAQSGQLRWKFEPENNTTVTSLGGGLDSNGCGDMWSSPAVDPTSKGDGLVIGTTGNCPIGSATPGAAVSPSSSCPAPTSVPELEGIVALDESTGCLVWRWSEPPNAYTGTGYPDGGDTDIGSSPIVATIQTATGPHRAVIDGSKSGFMYALDEHSPDPGGSVLWSAQPAQPGETGPSFAGAIGGFIGSSAFDTVDFGPLGGQRPTVFGTTAILTPFDGNGAPEPDTTLLCVDLSSGTPAPAPHCDPLRVASLHAVDANTGQTRWQGIVSLPSYAATTTTNGVVFAPSTTGFAITAYSAVTGTPLWAFPTGGAMSSGAAIVGPSVFVGAGTAEQFGPPGTPTIPPAQVNGVWCFSVA